MSRETAKRQQEENLPPYKPLTNLQRELLRVFAKELPEAQLLEIKEMVNNELGRMYPEGLPPKTGYTQEDYIRWQQQKD